MIYTGDEAKKRRKAEIKLAKDTSKVTIYSYNEWINLISNKHNFTIEQIFDIIKNSKGEIGVATFAFNSITSRIFEYPDSQIVKEIVKKQKEIARANDICYKIFCSGRKVGKPINQMLDIMDKVFDQMDIK